MNNEAFTFKTTQAKRDWLDSLARKTNRSVDYLINLLIDGYLEDIEAVYDRKEDN